MDRETGKLFSYASPESLVPQDHPLRKIREMVNAALERLSPAFQAIYAQDGRPSLVEQNSQSFHDARIVAQQAVDTPEELKRIGQACEKGT
jgi:hypothetical protein